MVVQQYVIGDWYLKILLSVHRTVNSEHVFFLNLLSQNYSAGSLLEADAVLQSRGAEALVAPQVRATVEKNGIRLVSYRDLG